MRVTTHGALGFAAATILVAVFALRLLDAAQRNSLTIDEPHYVGVGLYLWESGDYHFFETLNFHPPLAHHLAGLPLLGLDLGGRPITRNIGSDLLAASNPDPRRVRWLSRTPFVALACWGALLIFLWAREVAGPWAGVLALGLYTFSPSVLAHASLVHSDITVTVFFLQTLYTFWRWWSRPGPLRFALCGLSLGLALLAKLSALILLPALGLLLLAMQYRLAPFSAGPGLDAGEAERRSLFLPGLKASALLAGLILLASFAIWVGYGFSFAIHEGIEGPYAGVPLPSLLQALLFDVAANTRGRNIYFFGEIAGDGRFWHLLPVAWALKTPVPALLLMACALLPRRILRAKPELDGIAPPSSTTAGQGAAAAMVGVVVAIFLATVIFWLRVPLGLRYLLPIVPLIFLFVATRLASAVGGRRAVIVGLVVWLAAAGSAIHPHYLSYFNALAGGPSGAHRYLVDSNFDWGQDLGALADEVKARGNPPLWIAYFGPEPPGRYGLDTRPLPGCRPVTGWVAISATFLRGLYSPDNPFVSAPAGCYDWLLSRDPVAEPGHSILLYEIRE